MGILFGSVFLRTSQGRISFVDNFSRAGKRGILFGDAFLRMSQGGMLFADIFLKRR